MFVSCESVEETRARQLREGTGSKLPARSVLEDGLGRGMVRKEMGKKLKGYDE